MKRYFLITLIGVAGLISQNSAQSSPAIAKLPALPLASPCAPRAPLGSLLDYYDKLPGKHFTSFGGVNRRSLLKRPGAIVDYKRNFIEIPGSIKGNGDLQKLQISLFPNGREPWIAVSRIVWPQARTPGTLDFYYGYNDAGGLREAAADFFPYQLQKRGASYENAYLPRQGLTIEIREPNSRDTGLRFRYNPNFAVGESAFVRS